MSAEGVRLVRSDDVNALAWTMAQAFQNDPMSAHLLPDPRTRLDRMARVFRLFLTQLYLRDGHSYTIGDTDGGALWLSPAAHPPSGLQQLRMLPGLSRVFGLLALPRRLRDLAQMESIHPKRPPHWYLGFLGVRPSKQGCGLGGKLLQPVLQRCDADRMPAYLETSNVLNLPLYERHGFSVIAECDIERGPHVWGMWREPRS
jgi:GNAT superfamily N-acetyltransferase